MAKNATRLKKCSTNLSAHGRQCIMGFLQPVSGWSSCQDLEKRAIQGYDENLVEVDIFAVGIPETSHITPVLLRRSYIDDIAFFGFDWSDMCQTCDLF